MHSRKEKLLMLKNFNPNLIVGPRLLNCLDSVQHQAQGKLLYFEEISSPLYKYTHFRSTWWYRTASNKCSPGEITGETKATWNIQTKGWLGWGGNSLMYSSSKDTFFNFSIEKSVWAPCWNNSQVKPTVTPTVILTVCLKTEELNPQPA